MSNPEPYSENPFQPPQVQQTQHQLPFDTEFLISDTCILCDGDVHLPKVCIVSGSTNDLTSRHGKLRWAPAWITLLASAAGLATPVAIGLSFEAYRLLTNGIDVDVETAVFVSVWAITTPPIVFGYFALRRRVKATWYLEKSRIERWKNGWLLFAGGAAILLLAWMLFYAELNAELLVLIGVVGFVLLVTPPARPYLHGTHNELNVVMGLSPKFLERVQTIIDQYSKQTHEQR